MGGCTTAGERYRLNPANARPPRWAESVLRLALDERSRDTITGDLLEEYRERIVPERGVLRAQFWYAWQAATLVALVRRSDMKMQLHGSGLPARWA